MGNPLSFSFILSFYTVKNEEMFWKNVNRWIWTKVLWWLLWQHDIATAQQEIFEHMYCSPKSVGY